MTNSVDYYDVLGCTRESSYEDIKRAYHALALEFHPDKSASESCTLKFQRILEAWKTLSEPKTRKEYDAACKQAELDSESVLVYAKLSLDQLESDYEDILSYPCRCGSKYYVERHEVLQKNRLVHVPCQECTFVIVVET